MKILENHENHVVFETEDKIKLTINFEYHSIYHFIYFDEITEDNFVEENIRYNKKEERYKGNLFFATSIYNEKPISIVPLEVLAYGEDYTKIRELNSDEAAFIRKIAKEKDEIFTNKLRDYYKNNKDLIYGKGYYANR